MLVFLLGCSDDDVAPPPVQPGACDGAVVMDLDALYGAYERDVHPLLTRPRAAGGCVECHNPSATLPVVMWADDARLTMDRLWEAGYLALDGETTLASALAREDGLRMPLGAAAWSDEDRATVSSFVCNLHASGLEPAPICVDARDPGNTLIRRLSNFEYDRTLGDTTGDTTAPGRSFASDQPAHGFDNVASGQQFSLGHFEQYQTAAEATAHATLLVPAPIALGLEAEDLSAFKYTGSPVLPGQGHGGAVAGEHWHFQRIRAYVTSGLQYFPYDGVYTIGVRARGKHDVYRQLIDEQWVIVDDDVAPAMRIEVDGVEVDVVDVVGVPFDHDAFGAWQLIERSPFISAGTHTVRVWLDNVTFGGTYQRDVELDVDYVHIDGPGLGDLPAPDEARIARFLICDGQSDSCADDTITHALTTLWRRPATSAEIDRYRVLIDDALNNGETFKDGVEAVLDAALLSPHFLFRPEIDPDPAAPETRPLEPHELATRLSYFLWSSVPDAPLLAAAQNGLTEDDVLSAEVDRMLDDPRAAALTNNFAAQWLHLGPMQTLSPSAEHFPEFDDALRDAMVDEVRLLFQDFLDNDRDLLQIVDTDFTYLNARLAEHYGIDMPGATNELTRVELSDDTRGGLLSSAGFLTLSSHPARTSPIKRGKWILEQLLCQPPGDPPADADTTVDTTAADSLQEFLQQHRADPACSGCHASMDAMGITLEHYDPIGRYRSIDDWGNAVQPVGELPSGDVLDGHEDMVAYVANHPGFEACITMKMLIYALGRDPDLMDTCAVADVKQAFANEGHTIRALVKAVVMSPMFRQRRPELAGEYDDQTQGEG